MGRTDTGRDEVGAQTGSREPRSAFVALLLLVVGFAAGGCDTAAPRTAVLSAQQSIDAATFAGLIDRISESGGYFDTDNLISNETGYLKVMGALAQRGLSGGAYVGVGPDQNFSYIAELRPSIVFIVDVRRDNMLHHLLLKALVEVAPTRVEFLARLHGVEPPANPEGWEAASVQEVVDYVDSAWAAAGGGRGAGAEVGRGPDAGAEVPIDGATGLDSRVRERIESYGVELTDDDLATIARFHRTFMAAGPSLRFTTFGRAPRPYYPTYRQLVLETDAQGEQASYLATSDRYGVVRELQLANRIIPVVGDLAGDHAVAEIGAVLAEMGVELHAFYASNVEYYLWQGRTFSSWLDNVRALPAAADAVVIRSYFANFGRAHPSAIPGYYAVQSLHPWDALAAGDFDSYWDVVTRDVIPLR